MTVAEGKRGKEGKRRGRGVSEVVRALKGS
jgi:hypothetical protein